VLSLQLARDRARQSEAVRIHMSPWQCRILKPQSSAIRDALNGSKPRMHSFEAVWCDQPPLSGPGGMLV